MAIALVKTQFGPTSTQNLNFLIFLQFLVRFFFSFFVLLAGIFVFYQCHSIAHVLPLCFLIKAEMEPGQNGSRTIRIQDNLDPGQSGSRTIWIQDNMDPGQNGSRTKGIQDKMDPGQDGSRTRWIQDKMDPGQ